MANKLTRAVSKPHEEYFEFLANNQFMIQHSPSTGQYVFYPRVAAPKSGATDLQWVPASGNGVVYATTTVRPRPPEPAYNVSLIELEEGPRMMSRVEGVDAEQVKIGMPVTARIISEADGPVVIFDAAKS
jgi:uncharacterized OB-fold protein